MSKHKFNEIRVPIEDNNISIVRDRSKCIKCGKCKDVCTHVMGVCGKYDLIKTCDEAVCINCGQCVKCCPVGSIRIRPHWMKVKSLIAKPNKIAIVSTAPSVRVALGDGFNMPRGAFVEGKMVALLKALGFKYVLDVNFGADMTIMEEASELLERLDSGDNLPMFTSCCPAWVKYVETFYPNFIGNLSTCKSPIAMMGTTIKTYFANQHNINPNNIVHVSITPCTAKKFEAAREEMNDAGATFGNLDLLDTDYVVTTQELIDWANCENIDLKSLPDEQFDTLMGASSGGGTIFGSSGGVAEAMLRCAYKFKFGKVPAKVFKNFENVRGTDNLRISQVQFGDRTLNVAVVFGTAKAAEVLEQIKSKQLAIDVMEVMACPGGCVGGGGQPKDSSDIIKARATSIYTNGDAKECKVSADNAEIVKLYSEYYGKPLSNKSKDMLHTIYTNRSEILTRNKYIENVAAALDDGSAE